MESLNRNSPITTCNGGAELNVTIKLLPKVLVVNYSRISHEGVLVGPDNHTYKGYGHGEKHALNQTVGRFITGHCFDKCYPKNKCLLRGKPIYEDVSTS